MSQYVISNTIAYMKYRFKFLRNYNDAGSYIAVSEVALTGPETLADNDVINLPFVSTTTGSLTLYPYIKY